MSAPCCRRLTSADLPSAAAVEATAPEPWGLTALTEHLQSPSGHLFGLFEGDALLGAAVLQAAAGEGELLSITLHPTCRGKKLSRSFLNYCLQQLAADCDTCFLEVRSQNAPALALYRSLGFKAVGKRPGFYRNPPDDAVVMRLDFPLT